jgi:hypothetical protein
VAAHARRRDGIALKVKDPCEYARVLLVIFQLFTLSTFETHCADFEFWHSTNRV